MTSGINVPYEYHDRSGGELHTKLNIAFITTTTVSVSVSIATCATPASWITIRGYQKPNYSQSPGQTPGDEVHGDVDAGVIDVAVFGEKNDGDYVPEERPTDLWGGEWSDDMFGELEANV